MLRFLGYAGVQLNALLVPLLVFELSGSTAMAGLALLVEWAPKLGLYLAGGAIISRFGHETMHLVLDVGRLGAMAGLVTCSLGAGSVWVVALCAAIYQCSNALSNILFEGSVTHWWQFHQRPSGHARMLRSDQLGCLLALLLGLLLGQPWMLAAVGLTVQFATTLRVAALRRRLYPQSAQSPSSGKPFPQQLLADARAAARPQLLRLGGASILVGIPAALLFSSLTFYLDRAQPGAAGAQNLSLLLLLNVGTSLVALQIGQALLRNGVPQQTVAAVGLTVLVSSALLLTLPLPLTAFAAVVLMLGASGNLYLPLVRHARQALIERHVAPASSPGATGILVSVEAAAYFAAAGLLALLGADLALLALVAAAFGLTGAVLVLLQTGQLSARASWAAAAAKPWVRRATDELLSEGTSKKKRSEPGN